MSKASSPRSIWGKDLRSSSWHSTGNLMEGPYSTMDYPDDPLSTQGFLLLYPAMLRGPNMMPRMELESVVYKASMLTPLFSKLQRTDIRENAEKCFHQGGSSRHFLQNWRLSPHEGTLWRNYLTQEYRHRARLSIYSAGKEARWIGAISDGNEEFSRK